MEEHGTKFIEGAVPAAVEKLDSGRKKVTWMLGDGSTASDEFDTVMFAVGRDACTSGMGLEAAGVQVNANHPNPNPSPSPSPNPSPDPDPDH